MSDLQEALKARDEAQSACRAWQSAFECIEAHIRDRIAMKDEAQPRVYLQIIKTAVDNINRESAAIVAARWADGTRYQITLDKMAKERDKLLAACKGLAALDRTPDRFASPELLAARAAIREAEPPAASERATGGGA